MKSQCMVVSGRRQSGVVLVVALLMLLMVTMMAVSGFRMTQSNLLISQNMESKAQSVAAANAAIEEAISSTLFTGSPNGIFETACGAGNRKCYDFNGDGVDDIAVSVEPPSCVVVKPKLINDLDLTNPREAACVIQDSVYSLCSDTVWEFRAVAVDSITGAQAQVRQGVAIVALAADVETACP